MYNSKYSIMRYNVKVLLLISIVACVCSCKIQDVPGPYAVAKPKKTVSLPKEENKDARNNVGIESEDAVAEVVPISSNHSIVSKDEFVEEPSLVKKEEMVKDEPMKKEEALSTIPAVKEEVQEKQLPETEPKEESVKEVTRSEKFDVVDTKDKIDLKNYNVVIGSFSKKENAENLKNSMKADYSPIIVVNEKGMFRVLLASYDEYVQARSLINVIHDKFPDAWVLVQKK